MNPRGLKLDTRGVATFIGVLGPRKLPSGSNERFFFERGGRIKEG